MAKIVNVKQPDPVVTVRLSNGQEITGTMEQLKTASRIAEIAAAHGITNEEVLAAVRGEYGIGHNSQAPHEDDAQEGDAAGRRLKSFLERIERLEEEKAGTAEDIKEVYAEAKGTGFEPRIMRRLIRLRKMDVEKRREEDELLELYKASVGMN